MRTKILFPLIAGVMLIGQGAHASACNALADFFSQVVEVSGAEYDKKRFGSRLTGIRNGKDACLAVTGRMAESNVYTHDIGGKLVPLQDYLVDDARFAVRVIGEGDKIELIRFDAGTVSVLRRRPTR